MPNDYIDLHLHTTASDGLLNPKEVVDAAADRKLRAISITDHDTTDGFVSVIDYTREKGIEIIPGVELSCMYNGADVHILGYFIDYKDAEFMQAIKEYCRERYNRGVAIVKKLNEIGINIKMDTVSDIAGEGAVGRPHVAQALVREEYVQTFDEAFARYLGYHAPAYVPKKHLDVDEAISMLHRIGGAAVLAHPGTLRHDDFIPHFAEAGLDGIEAYHSLHKRKDREHYKQLAGKYGMFYSGGSDCHGPRKGSLLIGTQKVPYSCLEQMKEAMEKK
ncbi:MAG: PHP domain-containing protein [candidate division Zixibacteria bacterium]|nr:PHP domain-containing protein [candidate division Zixibacteria bacterium]